MKIVADENIPFVRDLFAPLGDLVLRPGREIRPSDVEDCDILLVRSVTKVDEYLLARSSVKFVGTCTIGVDHLDIGYLNTRQIPFASAPGCNATAVAQYVVSVLAAVSMLSSDDVKKIAIVGGGNVGSAVYAMLSCLGFECVCVDPFIQSKGDMVFVDIEEIVSADVISCHTPLTYDGPHPTHHMIGRDQLSQLKSGALLINAGRGGVVDNIAALEILNSRDDLKLVLDVWENEPNINADLLEKVFLGTPHIAGYSFDGRVKGSLMIFDALCRVLQLPAKTTDAVRASIVIEMENKPTTLNFSSISDALLQVYDAREDFNAIKGASEHLAERFDHRRKHYPLRREYTHFRLQKVPINAQPVMQKLGFTLAI